MTPQKQSKLYSLEPRIYGNCMMACYASYLDLKLSDCPPIEELFISKKPNGFWDHALKLWFEIMGYKKLVYLSYEELIEENPNFNDYYFAAGDSPRGVKHLTIWKDGKLFFDPHPSDAGISTIDYIEVLTLTPPNPGDK